MEKAEENGAELPMGHLGTPGNTQLVSCQGAQPHCHQETAGHQNLLQSLGTTPKPPQPQQEPKSLLLLPLLLFLLLSQLTVPEHLQPGVGAVSLPHAGKLTGHRKQHKKKKTPKLTAATCVPAGRRKGWVGGAALAPKNQRQASNHRIPEGCPAAASLRCGVLFYFVLPAAPHGLEPSPATPRGGTRLALCCKY